MSKSFSDAVFQKRLTWNGIRALSPTEMAKDFESSPEEWYHLALNVSDFELFIRQPNIKWYGISRCHLDPKKAKSFVIEDDDTTYTWNYYCYFENKELKCRDVKIPSAREHIHALICFTKGSCLGDFECYLNLSDQRIHRQTDFKRILCLDHAVSVLGSLSCRDGAEICASTSHVRYSRKVFDKTWNHSKRNGRCDEVRGKISQLAALGVKDLSRYSSPMELHDRETCFCMPRYGGKEIEESGFPPSEKEEEDLQVKDKPQIL